MCIRDSGEGVGTSLALGGIEGETKGLQGSLGALGDGGVAVEGVLNPLFINHVEGLVNRQGHADRGGARGFLPVSYTHLCGGWLGSDRCLRGSPLRSDHFKPGTAQFQPNRAYDRPFLQNSGY